MRAWVAIGAVLMAAQAVPAAAQSAPAAALPADQARVALARQIIAVAYPGDAAKTLITPMMARMMDVLRANTSTPPGFEDPGLKALLDDFLNGMPLRMQPVMERQLPVLLDAIAQAYARSFATDDLQAILAFAQTPAGTHYFQRAATVMSDPAVGAAIGALARDSQATNLAAAQEFQGKVKAYLAAHPDVAARLKDAASAGAIAPPARH